MSPRQVLRAFGFAGLGAFWGLSRGLPLQALVDRLTPGEADDLLSQLPAPLWEAVTVEPEVVQLPANQFIQLIAEELQITPAEARARARAVIETIREAVTPGEFHDVLVQLPSGFYEHIMS